MRSTTLGSYDDLFEKIRPTEISRALDTLQAEITERQTKQATLQALLKAMTGISAESPTHQTSVPLARPTKPAKTRVRRSGEDLEKLTDQAIRLIESGGPEGIAASEIKAKLPELAKVQSLKVHLNQYGGKGRFTTKGEKVGMRYFPKP